MAKSTNLLFVMGPTASGKSSAAANIANHFNTEVISADSRQFYKDIPIGTAHPSTEELALAPHHFIGNLNLDETWSAATFANESLKLIQKEVFNPLAIFCGGSGFYLRALEFELDDVPVVPENYRSELLKELELGGINPLIKELEEKDPTYFKQVDTNNSQRVIRALEVIRYTGKSLTHYLSGKPKRRPFNFIKLGLEMDREMLYQRINARVDLMFENGLLEEAKAVYPFKSFNSLNTVGYKELFAYFKGELSLDQAKEEIKKNTRRFAKRQLTWLRREENITFFHPNQLDEMFSFVKSNLKLP